MKEHAALEPERQKLMEKFLSIKSPDPKLHCKLIAIERKISRLSEKAESDYGREL